MLSKSTILHLRFPFSFFLLPIFLFAVAASPNLLINRLQWVFIILHLFVYPASNGYNSYFDNDEQSIGGLKHPPPVSRQLYWTSLFLDLLAIVLAVYFIDVSFAVMVLIYGLVSKAYSHPSVRLKKYAIAGWVITGFFQGFFMFMMCYAALNKYELANLWQVQIVSPAATTTLMLWANYPMTQVYQHEEDKRHGDMTLSLLLGIRGTFLFAAGFFGLAVLAFVYYFSSFHSARHGAAFLLVMTPIVVYFMFWFLQVWRKPAKADYAHTMVLNMLSSTCLSAFFIWLLFDIRNVGRYLFD